MNCCRCRCCGTCLYCKDGIDGIQGSSAYDLAIFQGFKGTIEEWLESLNGKDGINGASGENGISAYGVWISQGNIGNEQDFLDSLEGKQGIQGIQGEKGIQGQQGIEGKQGLNGSGVPTVVHGTLPLLYSRLTAQVGNDVRYMVQNYGDNNVKVYVQAIHNLLGDTVVDIKCSSQQGSNTSRGQTLQNSILTNMFQEIDIFSYADSTEMHNTWIRQQNPSTKLWSLHEANLFVSMNGMRVDIWINEIYSNFNSSW